MKVWEMEAEVLEKHVAERILAGERIFVNDIVRDIKQFKDGGRTAEDVIEHREQERRGQIW